MLRASDLGLVVRAARRRCAESNERELAAGGEVGLGRRGEAQGALSAASVVGKKCRLPLLHIWFGSVAGMLGTIQELGRIETSKPSTAQLYDNFTLTSVMKR